MSFWLTIPTFDGGNGAGVPFPLPSPYLAKPMLQFRSQAPDVLKFEDAGPYADSNAIAAEGTLCTLSNGVPGLVGSEVLFVGTLFQIPRDGSGSSEGVSYEIRGPWQDLTNTVFQQQWNILVEVIVDGQPQLEIQQQASAHVLLGVDINGNPQTNGQVIEEIIAWAITCGINIQLGVIDPACNAPVPVDDVHDLPMAECLKKMLRWTPDAVAWFDYAATFNGQPCPAFHVTRRPNCPALNLAFAPASGVEAVKIKARPDLQKEYVVIRYEQVGKSDNTPVVNYITDAYPVIPNVDTSKIPGALVSTMELAGVEATTENQPVRVQQIPPNIPDGGDSDGVDVVGFVQQHWPWLATFTNTRLEILDWGTWVQQPDPGPAGGAANNDYTVGDYPNELLSGSLPDWVKSQGIISGMIGCSGIASYIYPDHVDTESQKAFETFGPDEGGVPNFDNAIPFTFYVHGTNASNTVYTTLSSYTSPEQPPIGLAQYLWQAWNQLQYEGSYATVGQEISGQPLGIVLNLLGSRAEWQTMNALVQSISFDLENGQTTYEFGPAEHLTVQDLMEQLRATRTRKVSSHIKQRTTGKPGDAPTVDGAGETTHGMTTTQPTPGYPFLNFDAVYTSTETNLPAAWAALLGYGSSSFAGDMGYAGPLEEFELDVGNTGDSWPESVSSEMSGLKNLLSIISGDGDYTNDRFWMGATNSDENSGGGVMISPGDPSLIMSGAGTMDPGDLGGNIGGDVGIPFVQIDLSEMLLGIQDENNAYILGDLSNNPLLSLFLDDGNEIDLDTGNTMFGLNVTSGSQDAEVYLEGQDGGNIDANTGDINAGSAYFQQITFIGSGGTIYKAYVLCTAPESTGSLSVTGTCNGDGTITVDFHD